MRINYKSLILSLASFVAIFFAAISMAQSKLPNNRKADRTSDVANATTKANQTKSRHIISARASEIDPTAKEYPELNFVFNKDGKPTDVQHAIVDRSVPQQHKLVIWLMAHNDVLFDKLAGYGLHAISVHYANGWFGKFGSAPPPADLEYLGNIRLEAATGIDSSSVVSIDPNDSIAMRATRFVAHLAKTDPKGDWKQYLSRDGATLNWDKVILSGSSHGSTTAARFAKQQKVARVVLFCGPRDQYDNWQSLPSATPANRFFAFSHVLDSGWTGDHYCRSWQMLGLSAYGPTIDVDNVATPYEHTRRLITKADVGGDANKAHGSVTPGRSSPKNADGSYIFDDVWDYMFNSSIDQTGEPQTPDSDCKMDLR